VDFIGVVSGVIVPRLQCDYLLAVANDVIQGVEIERYQISLVFGVVHVFGSHASNLSSLCKRSKCILLFDNKY
jgi:hypothetical protein